ncbi:MAG TPA: FeoB-associated Cys-rich membrane protein [Clostridiaceae bacterium]|nr:FeoB-associated Cys-rich membrane protein [Clostridiaceae bacterium]
MGNVIIGLVFAVIFIFALKKVYIDAKNKKCSCGSACSGNCKYCK